MWDHDFAMPDQSSASSEAERRGAERFPCNGDMVCRLIEPSESRSSQVGIRDISQTGICLLLPAQFQTGTELTIQLENPRLPFTHPLTFRVHPNAIPLPN